MPDINHRTGDVTVYGEDGTLGVTVETDADGKNRFFVDTKLGAVAIGAIVNEANIFKSSHSDINSKAAFSVLSYTVPAGKKFLLTAFHASADHPLAIDVALRVNGVEKIEYYLDPAAGNDERQLVLTTPTLFATAGQTIDVYIEPTMPRGEINIIYVGIELTA